MASPARIGLLAGPTGASNYRILSGGPILVKLLRANVLCLALIYSYAESAFSGVDVDDLNGANIALSSNRGSGS
jgi:hypothetical protein